MNEAEGDPVSWFLIARGWEVVDAEGETIGHIEDTVGDSSHDIFDGLSIYLHLLSKPLYVPAEQVGLITQGRVHLRLTGAEVARLGEYESIARKLRAAGIGVEVYPDAKKVGQQLAYAEKRGFKWALIAGLAYWLIA